MFSMSATSSSKAIGIIFINLYDFFGFFIFMPIFLFGTNRHVMKRHNYLVKICETKKVQHVSCGNRQIIIITYANS